VLADYVYVGRTHVVQGIDRLFASCMVIRLCVLGAQHIGPWRVHLSPLAPFAAPSPAPACFLLAAAAGDTQGLGAHTLIQSRRRYLTIAALPIGCFCRASVAKKRRDFQMWVTYHTLWHVVGAAVSVLTVYLISNAPSRGRDGGALHGALFGL
jgi:hypothetical protein